MKKKNIFLLILTSIKRKSICTWRQTVNNWI